MNLDTPALLRVAGKPFPSTLPPSGGERTDALKKLAAELVRVLGAPAAVYLIALVDEVIASNSGTPAG